MVVDLDMQFVATWGKSSFGAINLMPRKTSFFVLPSTVPYNPRNGHTIDSGISNSVPHFLFWRWGFRVAMSRKRSSTDSTDDLNRILSSAYVEKASGKVSLFVLGVCFFGGWVQYIGATHPPLSLSLSIFAFLIQKDFCDSHRRTCCDDCATWFVL